MRKILLLTRLSFLNPYGLFLLYRAKRKHKANGTFLLKFAADFYRDQVAIADETDRYTFEELYRAVRSLSHVIRERHPSITDQPVIFACNNSTHHVLMLFALQNLGTKVILVNDRITAPAIQKIFAQEDARCLLIGTSLPVLHYIDVDELIALAKEQPHQMYYSTRNARLVFPTSGTTGESKLIEKKSGEFYWLQAFADLVKRTNIDQRNAMYLTVPVSHGFGYTALLFTLVMGKKTLLLRQKDPAVISNKLVAEAVDIIVGVPTALYKTAELIPPGYRVHTIINGGAALNETIFKRVAQIAEQVYSMYGSTEASTSFIADKAQLERDVCSLGTPLKGVQYKLHSLAGGEKELMILSPMSNAGTSSGWIATGDLVEESPEGAIIWKSRKDDMIIKQGLNIYPVEIEKQLLEIPSIEDAYVRGEKDDIKGERIIAFIQLRPGMAFNLDTVSETLRAALGSIKVPDQVVVLDSFSYTSTGKKIRPTSN